MAGAKKLSSSPAKTKPSTVSGKDKVSNGEDLVGSKVRVWWPIDRKFYNGVVDSFNSRTKKHRVFYDDGEKEILDMNEERWELMEEGGADEDKSDNEIVDPTPEPTNRKSAKTNGVMGDIGGKMVAAASRLRSCNKIPEATNGKKKRASSSPSEAVSEKETKPMTSSKKRKMNMTDDEDVGDDVSDDESKPLQILVDKLKGKKKKRQEKEAPKEETKEGEPMEETKEGEEPKEETKEGEEPKEEAEVGEEPKEEAEPKEEGEKGEEPKEEAEEDEPKEEGEKGEEPKEEAEEDEPKEEGEEGEEPKEEAEEGEEGEEPMEEAEEGEQA